MKPRKLALLAILAAFGVFLGAGTASAAPMWNLELHHGETNFPSGETGELWFSISNVGNEDTAGPIGLTVNLPGGFTRASVSEDGWSCPGSPGDEVVTCSSEVTFPRHAYTHGRYSGFNFLGIVVNVDPSADGQTLLATATIEGGGASLPVTDSEPIQIGGGPAGFGIVPGSWKADFYEADGLTPVRESGAHPDLATFAFDYNNVTDPVSYPSVPNFKTPAESIRNVDIELPPGFVGNPSALGECTPAQLLSFSCPRSSQLGRVDIGLEAGAGTITPTNFVGSQNPALYNMSHPKGAITDFAVNLLGNVVHIKAGLDPANNYAVKATTSDINQFLPLLFQKVTVWGVPGDPSHDSERCSSEVNYFGEECPTEASGKAFLTLPSQCNVDREMRLLGYDSWENSGVFGPEVKYAMPGQTTDCDVPRFEPTVSLEPTGKQANTPTGLDVSIHIPQNENPNGVATPPVKSTVATFPEGMAFSPSFADGLAGCTPAQIGLGTNDPVACPDNSRIGEATISTPLVPKLIEGSLYLAKQEDNPFNSLIAFYMAFHDTEERGVLIKVPGKVDLDPVTGRITASFTDLPQFPFEDLTVKFRSGARAPLTNPPTCGSHSISLALTSYAQPDKEVTVSNSYQVNQGPGGGPCQNVASQRPFDPQLLGGTENPLAGAFSPLSVQISRTDADQELLRAEGVAPFGLTASIRGVSRCSEAQISAAIGRSEPGEGALELASPSCPANSQVGSIDVGVGAGPSAGLIYVPGKIYLGGPYKGAPLSGVVVVPGRAGPLDIGNVVVRAPAYIDPITAEIRVATDNLPQTVHGVLVRVRDVRVNLDRPNFTLNPTGCDPKSLKADIYSPEGALKRASSRFQVGDCAALGFKPRLALNLKGGTKRGGHPGLRAIYRPRAGDSNVKGLLVRLPRSAFLDQAHIRTICTRVQFAAENCPPAAQYGYVKAWTPLLDEPLEGPVYLRSSNHKLPDLVFDLHGEVDFQVATRIDSARGGIRARIESAPDVPLSKVDLKMQGGKKGLIVNSRNLCARTSKANVTFTGQNGKEFSSNPVMKADCGGKRKAKR